MQTKRGIVPVKEAKSHRTQVLGGPAHEQPKPEESSDWFTVEAHPEESDSGQQEFESRVINLDDSSETIDVPASKKKPASGSERRTVSARMEASAWAQEELPKDFWRELDIAKRANTMDSGRLAKKIAEEAPQLDVSAPREAQAEQELRQRQYICEVMLYFGFPGALAGRILETDEKGNYVVNTKYLPVRKLTKSGAMGKVFEARDLNAPERELVMKAVYPEERPLHDSLFERFRREALALAAIRNKHVLGIKSADFMPDKSGGWYVMDKVKGGDAEALIKQQPMPVEQAMDMFDQVAEGLAAAHAKGVVHRDVKPANIFVQSEHGASPIFQVGDFGLAKIMEEDEDRLELVRQQLLDIADQRMRFEDLEKYQLDAAFAERLKKLYLDAQRTGVIDALRQPQWREKLAKDQRSKNMLEAMEKLTSSLSNADKEYTHDLMLGKLRQEARNWITGEINRLSRKKDTDAGDIDVPQEYNLLGADKLRIAELAAAVREGNNPDAAEIEALADRVELNPNLTRTGSVLGTPYYMSPEQASSSSIDARSDVFSLGSVMYEALTGRKPFQGRSFLEVLKNIITTDPDLAAEVRPEVPQKLSDLIGWMMYKDAKDRPSMDEVRQELRKIKAEMVEKKRAGRQGAVRSLLNKLLGS